MPSPPRTAPRAPHPALARLGRSASILAIALIVCAAPATAQVVLPPGFEDQVITGALDRPTAFAFLPDGRVLITEQETGNIWLLTTNHLIAVDPVIVVPDVRTDYVERGLLSVAIDPGWPARPYVYAHYTSTLGRIRLMRYTASGDLTLGTSGNLVLSSPYEVLGAPDDQPQHNGGALHFAPDGRLYLSLGEDFGWCPAQDSISVLGRVLRLDVSRLPAGAGGPPPVALLTPNDNPYSTYPDSAMRLTWAMGLRNPFRFSIDPLSGLLYLADVGDNTWEEFDEVGARFNGGWPFREGPAAYAAPPSCGPEGSGYDDPIDAYDHGEGSVIISAGMLRRGPGSFWPPHWEGNAFYADFTVGFVRMLHKQGGAWQRVSFDGQPDPNYFATGLLSPVDFAWGPDGDLWWLSHEDENYARQSGSLHRIHVAIPLGVDAPAGTPLTLSVRPNPARGATTLRFALPADSPVTLELVDVAGRVVTRLVEGSWSAGVHVVSWDGRDRAGRMTPAGLYFARLVTSAGVRVTRLTRVR